MKVVYATSTASVTMPGGWPLLVRKGSHWSADDPVVRQQPSLFSDDPRYGMSYSSPEVEQATAGPGEVRATRRG